MSFVSGKKYGLILKKKNNPTSSNKLVKNVFDSDSDSDNCINKSTKASSVKRNMKKQTLLNMQKAIEDDPTVYEYDSIYSDMKEKKEKSIASFKADKTRKPKYIKQLLKASEKRQMERLRTEERKIERERSKESGEFDDKLQFVTSAYKKRIREREEEEKAEKLEKQREEMLDVRKQNDVSAIYRHLYREQTKESRESPEVSQEEEQQDEDSELSSSSDEEIPTKKKKIDSDQQESILEKSESSSGSTSDEDQVDSSHVDPSRGQQNRSRDQEKSTSNAGDKKTSKFTKRADEKRLEILRQRFESRKTAPSRSDD